MGFKSDKSNGYISPHFLIMIFNFPFVEKLQNSLGTKGRTSIHRSGDHVSCVLRGFLSDSRTPLITC